METHKKLYETRREISMNIIHMSIYIIQQHYLPPKKWPLIIV